MHRGVTDDWLPQLVTRKAEEMATPSRASFNKKVREELICAVCLDFLREPKVLLCAHSFCQECLEGITTTQRGYRLSVSLNEGDIECPSCRHVTTLPDGRVDRLRNNYNLKRLVDIVSEEEKRTSREVIKRRGSVRPSIRDTQPRCTTHLKPLEYFCLDCNEMLCRKCMMAGHRDHNFHDIDEILPDQLAALRNLIQPAFEVSSRAEAMLQQLHKEKEIMASNSTATTDAVRYFFERMRKVLSQREKALLSTIQKYGDIKLTRLDTHHQKLREHRNAILQVVDKIEKMIQNGENVDILLQKQAISEELDVHQQSVLSISDMLTESQSSSCYLSFKQDNSLCHQMSEVGTLNECHRDPDSAFISVRRLIVSEDEDPYLDVPLRFEDEEASAPQKTMRFDETKQPLEFADETYDTPRPLTPPRTRKLPTPLAASAHLTTFKSSGYETYDVPTLSPRNPPPLPPRDPPPLPPRYSPAGNYSVPKAATLPARHANLRSYSFPKEPNKLSESEEESDEEYEPISLPPVPKPRVKPPPLPPDHPSRARKPVPMPRRRLVTSPVGDLAVLKRRSQTLPSGALSLPLSLPSVEPTIIQPILVIGNDQLSWPFSHETVYPCGVCCTSVHDTLVISDVFNHCVRLIDKKGTFIEKIGREGREGGQFKEPSAVAITDDNHILVAERDNPRIQKFTTMGKYLMKFGQKALWGSQLSDPLGIAVAENRNIFITDWDRSCVFVYQNNGKFVKTIGKEDEFFKSPAGIAIDRFGRLLITDRYNHCVWVLTPNGEMVSKIGSQGSLPGQLFYPFGITVTENGSIVVTESGNNRISVFSPKGELIRCFGKSGSEPGMFNHPRHVCVNSKGHIIVADEMNQRIQVFQLL